MLEAYATTCQPLNLDAGFGEERIEMLRVNWKGPAEQKERERESFSPVATTH